MKYLLAAIFALGILAAAVFSSFGYSTVAENIGSTQVADRYDDLARGIVEYGTLSYYPDPSPTVLRMPLYPCLLALCKIAASGRASLLEVALQCLLHGATTMLAAALALRVSGKRSALLTGIFCAFHPLLLWYSNRIVIESLSTFLFTAITLSAVIYWQKPSSLRASATGLAIGIGLWCKAVFLPLLFILPLVMFLKKERKNFGRDALLLIATGLLVISPWLVRNYHLTKRWPMFQALILSLKNLYVSDSFVDHACASPFGYAELIARLDYGGMQQGLTHADSLKTSAWLESRQDVVLTNASVTRYLHNPGFLLKKIGINGIWFWTLASSWKVSLLFGLLQVVLLTFVVLGVARLLRTGNWMCVGMLPVWLSLAYVLPHLPVYALARFSVIIIPVLLAVAVSTFVQRSSVIGLGLSQSGPGKVSSP